MSKHTHRPSTVFDQEKPESYVLPTGQGIEPEAGPDLHERTRVFTGLAEMGKIPKVILIGLIALVAADVYKGQPLSRKIVGMLNHPAEVRHPYGVDLDNQIVRYGRMADQWGDKNSINPQK